MDQYNIVKNVLRRMMDAELEEMGKGSRRVLDLKAGGKSLNIIPYYLSKNRCYQQAVRRTAKGIQLHSIGTGQGTAQSVADYWNQPSVSACVTYLVDCDTPGKVLQCLPETYYSWADAGYGNRNLITFEICESDSIQYTEGASYTVKDMGRFRDDIMRGYQTAVELCADICKRYGWKPKEKLENGLWRISSHDEGRRAGVSSAHVDPTHVWDRLGLTMDGFRTDVLRAMTEDTAEITVPKEQTAEAEDPVFRVQAGAFQEKGNADRMLERVRTAGYGDAFLRFENDLYKVQAWAGSRAGAERAAETLKKNGITAIIR